MMLLAILAAGCISVSGPNITAGDLANAVPGFKPADATATAGYSPTPGVRRVFHAGELHQTLAHFGFEDASPLTDICFERAVGALSKDAALEAMHKVLGADAHIEIVELSGFPVPQGEIVFPPEGLGMAPASLWQGYVQYDGDKKFHIWARTKITVKATRLIALEQLKPGVPIHASQVTLETLEEFPQKRVTPQSAEQVEGALPRRFIAPNSPVWSDSIDPPYEVTKGDRVTVTVNSGPARLSFDVEAETSGRRGDLIAFKNPDSGKVFRARVDGPDKAEIDTPSTRQP